MSAHSSDTPVSVPELEPQLDPTDTVITGIRGRPAELFRRQPRA